MMQRLRYLFQQATDGSMLPGQPTRPNQLLPEVVRAERLRREALQREAAAQDGERPRSQKRPAPESRPLPRAPAGASQNLLAALRSREGLQQAFLIHEILGPPVGMRHPDRESERP